MQMRHRPLGSHAVRTCLVTLCLTCAIPTLLATAYLLDVYTVCFHDTVTCSQYDSLPTVQKSTEAYTQIRHGRHEILHIHTYDMITVMLQLSKLGIGKVRRRQNRLHDSKRV